MPPATPDPDLEPGFPVQTYESPGSYRGGQSLHTQVGNIDADATLEIVVSALANGPLYAWKANGSLEPGWPLNQVLGAGYSAMGNLSTSFPGMEVFTEYFGSPQEVAYSGSGTTLPGWPLYQQNTAGMPKSLAEVGGGTLDDIVIPEGAGLYVYNRADATILPGWPVLHEPQTVVCPIGDLNNNGDLEVVDLMNGPGTDIDLYAFHHNGQVVSGFPVLLGDQYSFHVFTYPVIGDVDGDGSPEIVVVTFPRTVKVFSANGVLKRTMTITGEVDYGTAPALADLDGDGVPEIIVQSDGALDVWRGDGTELPGWPQTWASGDMGWSAPVVGDVDGDGLPDIAITTQIPGSGMYGDVRLFNHNGVMHPHFPKPVTTGEGAVPAIADIDLDGRNELVVSGTAWGVFRVV